MSRARRLPDLVRWLAEGDLRSDGLSPQVADLVLRNPPMLHDLLDAFAHSDHAVRGHAADAVERVSRRRPEWLEPHLRLFLTLAEGDRVPMVRWHMAMLLGNLAFFANHRAAIREVLLRLLDDPSPFVRSWAISGLCQVAREQPGQQERILAQIVPLRSDRSTAVQHRAAKAIDLLTHADQPLPPTWVKRKRLPPSA